MPAGPSADLGADAAHATSGAAGSDRAVTISPGLTLREFHRPGPIVGQILHANLTETTLRPAYLHTGIVTHRARLTRHARRAGAGESIRLRRDRDGAPRAEAECFEVELSHGVVTRRRSDPSGAVAAGTRVLLGVGAAARALAGLRVGDRVEVDYRPASPIDAEVGITGNVIMLHDGVVVAPPSQRQPRTAIGISADGTRVWLVTVDGRSEASVGMTYVRLATLLKSLGADDALNLDGGGSTTMVARMPGDDTVTVRNTPSDSAQRPVPNGIGFVTTAQHRR